MSDSDSHLIDAMAELTLIRKILRLVALTVAVLAMVGFGVCGAYAVVGNLIYVRDFPGPHVWVGVGIGAIGLLLAFGAWRLVKSIWRA